MNKRAFLNFLFSEDNTQTFCPVLPLTDWLSQAQPSFKNCMLLSEGGSDQGQPAAPSISAQKSAPVFVKLPSLNWEPSEGPYEATPGAACIVEAKCPSKFPKYQEKHRVYTNFFEKFARTFAFFPRCLSRPWEWTAKFSR